MFYFFVNYLLNTARISYNYATVVFSIHRIGLIDTIICIF